LLSLFPESIRQIDDCGKLPILIAVYNDASDEIVVALLKHYPEASRIPDNAGYLPIHYVTGSDSPIVVTELAQSYPESLTIKVMSSGFLPFHFYLRYRPLEATLDVVKLLVVQNPSSIHLRSRNDALPVHIAATCSATDIVEFLARCC
jgi:ankyrin repeat protein